MRLTRGKLPNVEEGDLTPMIDMTFQLIAFFMVLINFSEAEQDKRIRLPQSELAIPSDQPLEEPRTIQLTSNGLVLFQGDEVSLEGLRPLLIREKQVLQRMEATGPDRVTVIIRADEAVPTGDVQKVMQTCQDQGFADIRLRLKQKEQQVRAP